MLELLVSAFGTIAPVSYTHLDVYKRQLLSMQKYVLSMPTCQKLYTSQAKITHKNSMRPNVLFHTQMSVFVLY